jgi:hypothetical protein
VLKFAQQMTVDNQQAGLQLDLATTPDNHFAIAYFKQGEDTQVCATAANCQDDPPTGSEWRCISQKCVPVCTTPILGQDEVPVLFDWVRYASFDGTHWASEDIASISSIMLSGISLEFDGTVPTVAYLGGQAGLQICGGTDLMVARKTGNWGIQAAVQNSNQAIAGENCPKGQNMCDFGDVVGLWPAMAKAPNGNIGIAYRDIHNGYTKEAQDSSDLEFTLTQNGSNWSAEWLDLGRGSGLFSALSFGADNQPAVAYYNGKEGLLAFTRNQGPTRTSRCDEGHGPCPSGLDCVGSICSVVIDQPERAMLNESISMAIAPDGRYLVAYYDPDEQNLVLAHSSDGISWTKKAIDTDGNTGMYPSLVINPKDNMPVVAYYRCSEYRPGKQDCNPNQDGARMARFVGVWPDDLTTATKWKKNTSLINAADSNAFDGMHVKVAFLPNGQAGLAYAYSYVDPSPPNQTHIWLMFRPGSWVDE